MILNTTFSKYLLCMFIFMVCSVLFTACGSETQGTWFGYVFWDKMYLYQLTPVFLVGIVLIDQHYGTNALIRMGDRTKAIYETLILKYVFAVIYLNIFFALVVVITMFTFEAPFLCDIQYFIDKYLHFLLGFMLVINLSEIFKRTKLNALKISSVFVVYFLMVIELMALEPFMPFLNFSLFFGWVFNYGLISYVILLVFFFATLLYLIKCSSKKDIL